MEIAVCGGNHANVHTQRVTAPYWLKLVFLQDAKQLHLRLQAKLPDFVQEDRATVGKLEAAYAPLERPRECPLHMPEQFTLYQTSRDRAAVHTHEGTAIAGASVVDRARHEFLPRPGFSVNEHRRIRGSDLLDGVERPQQSWTIAHDLLEVVLRAQFLSEINVFPLQSCLQAGNFLVGLHILNRQCNLVRHFLQKKGILIRIVIPLLAHDAEQSDALSLKSQGYDAHRLDTLCGEAVLIGILLLFFKIAAHERSLMVEHPTAAGLVAADLQPCPKVVREQLSFHGEETKRISLRLVERNRASVE